ncbi:MAG: hypothetical protein J6C23_01115 [Clostridia bacterium]|nr:hypothetical protein [Clostridia bacterium]
MTDKNFLDFVLSLNPDFSARPMMGEYLLYYKGKHVANVCDNTLLLKDIPSVRLQLPSVQLQSPYEGAKPQIVYEEFENLSLLSSCLEELYNSLPNKKKK